MTAAPALASQRECCAGSKPIDQEGLDAFVAETTDLAAQMGPKQRLLLLDTSRHLAEHYRGA